MYAHKSRKGFFKDIDVNRKTVELYPGNEIYEIEVSIHENQKKGHLDIKEADYWGWLKAGDDSFSMVYPSYVQFSICFPYGHEILEERGEGKAYRLSVKEIGVSMKNSYCT